MKLNQNMLFNVEEPKQSFDVPVTVDAVQEIRRLFIEYGFVFDKNAPGHLNDWQEVARRLDNDGVTMLVKFFVNKGVEAAEAELKAWQEGEE